MKFIIAGQTIEINSLAPALDEKFIALHGAYFGQGTINWDEFEEVARGFFDQHPDPKQSSHDDFFNNFTVVWRRFIATRNYEEAERIWHMALSPALSWEGANAGKRIHKGTPYYFWGLTALQRGDLDKGYARLRRTWQSGDTVELHLPMPIRRIVANAQVKDDADRVALQRGPLVYCAEAVDNGGRVSDLILADEVRLAARDEPGLLGGVMTLRGPAQRATDSGTKPAELVAVPYYAWCHRGQGEMAVWLARTPATASRPAAKGG